VDLRGEFAPQLPLLVLELVQVMKAHGRGALGRYRKN
jgi:hypothetical protein